LVVQCLNYIKNLLLFLLLFSSFKIKHYDKRVYIAFDSKEGHIIKKRLGSLPKLKYHSKGNLLVPFDDPKEGHIIKKRLGSLPKLKYHSKFYSNIPCTNKRYNLNIAISNSIDHNEPFYILTNSDPKKAIKDYSYRFGSIEFEFKNQKSNGFYANDSQIKDLFTFNSLYTCICIASILATITGIDYSKNTNCYKDYKIKTSRIVNGKRRKDISFFRVGLILLEYCFNSPKPLNLFKRLILYDV